MNSQQSSSPLTSTFDQKRAASAMSVKNRPCDSGAGTLMKCVMPALYRLPSSWPRAAARHFAYCPAAYWAHSTQAPKVSSASATSGGQLATTRG